jgi:hypothetical protein
MFIACWSRDDVARPSGELRENPPLIGQKLVELLLVPEQPVQLGLIALDAFLIGEDLPLIRQQLPLIGEHLPLISNHLALVRNRRV